MARENYKRLIEFRLDAINKRLGTNYQTDYVSHYGGWNLYMVDENSGGQFRSTLGFDTRKSSPEMLAYLIWECRSDSKTTNVKIERHKVVN